MCWEVFEACQEHPSPASEDGAVSYESPDACEHVQVLACIGCMDEV